MDQYEYIRTAHRVYEKSIRQIQKETGHSRVTIRKVLQGEFTEYKRRSAQPYPVLEKYKDIIEGWLKEDLANPKKQRHTARRIFIRLVEEKGYEGSEVTVRRYVRQVKAKEGSDFAAGLWTRGRSGLGPGHCHHPGITGSLSLLLHALKVLR